MHLEGTYRNHENLELMYNSISEFLSWNAEKNFIRNNWYVKNHDVYFCCPCKTSCSCWYDDINDILEKSVLDKNLKTLLLMGTPPENYEYCRCTCQCDEFFIDFYLNKPTVIKIQTSNPDYDRVIKGVLLIIQDYLFHVRNPRKRSYSSPSVTVPRKKFAHQ